MTKRASTMLKEEIENMGPVRLSDVTDAQQCIISIIIHLADTGEITIPDSFPIPDKWIS